MANRFLISVAAAALIAGTGFANAQGMNREGGGAAGGGSTAQQGAPSERGAPSAAPMNRDSGPSGTKAEPGMKAEPGKGAQTDKMEGGKAKSAQDNQPAQKSQPSTASDTDRAKGGKDMKAEGREGKSGTNAETKGGMDSKSQTTTDTKSQTPTTTGQAGAGAKLSTEQQTKISTVIKQQNVAPVTNVNFAISVGTRVPRDVHFHTLPAEVVTIYPQWRGYNFIRVREQIVIIDPSTFEIVAVINV
jgi:hypothetical protein